jgi:hypothetical protein
MGGAGTQRAAYYRPAEVARMLRCSEWWVKEQARRRRIPFCWIGGGYLFTDEHVAAIVRLFEVQPSAAKPTTAAQPSPPAAADGSTDGPLLLRARRPRRSRPAATSSTAA